MLFLRAGQPETVSQRPQSRPYHEYVAQHRSYLMSCRSGLNKDLPHGQHLWRQMIVGFTAAGVVGLIIMIMGTLFITDAIKNDQPIIVMLCVMGIVFGGITLSGAAILDRHLISQKWKKCYSGDPLPASQCFHTCAVTYSPSVDQIGQEQSVESPPAYDSLASISLHPMNSETQPLQDQDQGAPIMVLPPKYEDVTQPLPDYSERSEMPDINDDVVVVSTM